MWEITDKQQKITLVGKWSSVFSRVDPFEIPFVDTIGDYLLFYPTYGYYLSEEQYLAVVKAAKELGDKGGWLSITEVGSDRFAETQHWWCDFPDYEFYRGTPSLYLETSFYSARSGWGVVTSHEDHAIVGGPPSFIAKLKAYYPTWRQDRESLIHTWKGKPNAGWLDEVLALIGSD